jgi:hypothetical protein
VQVLLTAALAVCQFERATRKDDIMLRHFAAATSAALLALALTGCSDRPRYVPSAAQLAVQGKDQVTYTAERDGTVWVTDEGNHKVMYSTHVHAGDRIEVDANRNQMLLNDRVVMDTSVHHNEHKIFFEPSEPVTAARAVIVPAPAPTPARTEVIIVRPPEIPPAATLRTQTTGEPVELRPDADGTVWVVSEPDHRVTYSGRVLRGDTLIVDPRGNRLSVNGRSVYSGALPIGRYEVYYMAGAQ